MFVISFSPVRRDDRYSLAASGEALAFDGQRLDLSVIPEGATLPAGALDCPWIAGPITREGGVIHLTLVLPHGPIPHPAPPEAQTVLYPDPIHIAHDGPVALPAWTPAEETEE